MEINLFIAKYGPSFASTSKRSSTATRIGIIFLIVLDIYSPPFTIANTSRQKSAFFMEHFEHFELTPNSQLIFKLFAPIFSNEAQLDVTMDAHIGVQERHSAAQIRHDCAYIMSPIWGTSSY